MIFLSELPAFAELYFDVSPLTLVSELPRFKLDELILRSSQGVGSASEYVARFY